MDDLKVTERKVIYLDDAIDVIDNHQFSIEYCKEHNIDRAVDISMARIALADLPSAQLEVRLAKIADLVEGTIDHFELDDAMDLLYQIKDVIGER